MKYSLINSKLFTNNRRKLIKELKENSIVIVNSNDEMHRNGDQFFPFRQNSNLFYLCGIDQEKTILILILNHAKKKLHEILFILRTNENIAIWEGHKYTKKEAQNVSGIRTIYWLDEFDTIMPELIFGVENIYLSANEYPKFSTELNLRNERYGNNLKEKYPNHNYLRLAPILTKLRLIKEPEEIVLMKKAGNITEKAFKRILKFVKPNVAEYEVEAEITHQYIANKATGHAYSPIIASGKSACVLHYVENNKICKDGDLLLMDFGAEYANYAADCTRTIPVNGKFTKRQKDIYNAVLRVMKKAITMLVPGTTINQYNKEVGLLMEKELLTLGLISKDDIKNQTDSSPAYSKYFMHGTSHFMGLDVHDVGSKDAILKPGMVLSCEPGIYIPEEGIGIRLEDDILIEENGQTNLLSAIPIEIKDIERLMKK